MKTSLIVLLVLSAFRPAVAVGAELIADVARCTGRLSAELEHQWLIYDPAASATERTRNDLADVLLALTTPETARDILAARVSAKHAHARLLQRGTFNDDPDDARWAAEEARRHAAGCAALVRGNTGEDGRV